MSQDTRKLHVLIWIGIITATLTAPTALAASGTDFSQCSGLSGPALGLCKAGTAISCSADNTGDEACIHITETYATITGAQAPWTVPCPCASLEGWDNDILTNNCGVGFNVVGAFVRGTSDVFPDGFFLITWDGNGGPVGVPQGVFSCQVRGTDPIIITELEFNACNASLKQFAANDDVICEELCSDGNLPPCSG